MTNELKSFKRDWQRWSAAEKMVAVTVLAVLAALLGAPVTTVLL